MVRIDRSSPAGGVTLPTEAPEVARKEHVETPAVPKLSMDQVSKWVGAAENPGQLWHMVALNLGLAEDTGRATKTAAATLTPAASVLMSEAAQQLVKASKSRRPSDVDEAKKAWNTLLQAQGASNGDPTSKTLLRDLQRQACQKLTNEYYSTATRTQMLMKRSLALTDEHDRARKFLASQPKDGQLKEAYVPARIPSVDTSVVSIPASTQGLTASGSASQASASATPTSAQNGTNAGPATSSSNFAAGASQAESTSQSSSTNSSALGSKSANEAKDYSSAQNTNSQATVVQAAGPTGSKAADNAAASGSKAAVSAEGVSNGSRAGGPAQTPSTPPGRPTTPGDGPQGPAQPTTPAPANPAPTTVSYPNPYEDPVLGKIMDELENPTTQPPDKYAAVACTSSAESPINLSSAPHLKLAIYSIMKEPKNAQMSPEELQKALQSQYGISCTLSADKKSLRFEGGVKVSDVNGNNVLDAGDYQFQKAVEDITKESGLTLQEFTKNSVEYVEKMEEVYADSPQLKGLTEDQLHGIFFRAYVESYKDDKGIASVKGMKEYTTEVKHESDQARTEATKAKAELDEKGKQYTDGVGNVVTSSNSFLE